MNVCLVGTLSARALEIALTCGVSRAQALSEGTALAMRAPALDWADPPQPAFARRSTLQPSFSPSLLATWGYGPRQLAEGGNPIMLCEAAMVPLFLREYAELVSGRCILYFLHNAPALHGFVKGGSHTVSLGRSIQIAHLLAASSGAQPRFESVDSAANWATGPAVIVPGQILPRLWLRSRLCLSSRAPVGVFQD